MPSPELATKLDILRQLLEKHHAEAVLLRRVSSFAWATCGAAAYVNTATTEGAASVVITRDHQFVVTNNIEAPRLAEEEGLPEQGWEFVVSPWETPQKGLQMLLAGKNLLCDVPFANATDISMQMTRLRARLTAEEGERMRTLGQQCAEVLTQTAHSMRPGQSEYELASLMGGEAQKLGIQPIVNLIATDERAMRYRHPLPTNKKLERYAMLVLSGRWHGLVCSVSRLVKFGKLPDEMAHRIRATAQVNAAFIAHSRPGATLSDLLAHGKAAYAATGFPDEWHHHHQGGVIGYEPREYLATSGAVDVLAAGQALAWNPTIAGAKMEDSILVGEEGPQILTTTDLWPVEQVSIPGVPGAIPCALALEL